MKLVRFEDGTFGIRKWFFGYWYKNLRRGPWTWRRAGAAPPDNYSDKDLYKVLEIYSRLKDKGTPL